MKLFAVSLWKHTELLKIVYDVSSFGYFSRSSITEYLKFASRTIIESKEGNVGPIGPIGPIGPMVTVALNKEEFKSGLVARCSRNSNGNSCLIISDEDYPKHLIFTIIFNQLRKHDHEYHELKDSKECLESFESLDNILTKYKNPREVDKITKIQENLDDVKEILHDAIEKVLTRGEKIEDLIQKSQDLSAQSKIYLRKTEKLNRCCKAF